ncbi:plastocyanin/azurin family copper-binding protein [Natronococcus sp. A-GB7]|uniref:cupredoxin domain-containing protein n=1 Tax=Natronococcus sp. A-GB7 TaxID=3037649 RepID=UPI00241E2D7C|nr:plastocyanin/azurin family copper-binding protein [Natronococcus sp. A-GB7]MDG5818486.1 plastocyanin/azurin family copper-binding protein [Natronococcus sp. A-GB7]
MDDRAPSRRRVLVGAASAGAVGLASLAGCVGDEEADDEDAGTDGDAEADDAETDEDVVEIETREGEDGEPNFVFDPSIAELEPGDTVRWVNTDGVFHTVTSTDSLETRSESGEFNEELAAEGDTVEWTPEEEGLQHYYCEPHVGFMIGTLAVGDVDDEEFEDAEEIHEDPEGVDEDADDADADDEDADDEDEAVDEEFVDVTGEDVVTVETRQGEDGEPDFVFDPAFVTVDEGTTIEWVNTDGVFHTVTSTDDIEVRSGGGEVFDSTISSEGATVEWQADEPGTQAYYCSPHAGFMYGAIEIE